MLLRHEDGSAPDVSPSMSELWGSPRLRGRVRPSKVRKALVEVRGAMRALIASQTKEPVAAKDESRAGRSYRWCKGRGHTRALARRGRGARQAEVLRGVRDRPREGPRGGDNDEDTRARSCGGGRGGGKGRL